MRHMRTGRKLSRRKAHRTAMLANLACSIIKHESVRTTEAKAKEVRPFIERMITFARRGDLHARRIVLSRLHDSEAVKKLFDKIGPRFVDRMGGYTRILKLGFRLGDNSHMALIQLVEDETAKTKTKTKKTRKKSTPKATKETKASVKEAAETTEEISAESQTDETAVAEEPAVSEDVETSDAALASDDEINDKDS